MDNLDRALIEAWERVGQRLLDRPWELVKRIERARRAELRRPVRAWAVAVRASDRRWGWEDFPNEKHEHLAGKGRRHRVVVSGERLGELIRPVTEATGVPLKAMAARLGRDERTVHDWLQKGVLYGQKEDNPDRRGGPGWVLKTRGAVDPQADGGVGPGGFEGGPGEWWGGSWREHWRRVPPELAQALVRVPRLRSSKMRRDRELFDDSGVLEIGDGRVLGLGLRGEAWSEQGGGGGVESLEGFLERRYSDASLSGTGGPGSLEEGVEGGGRGLKPPPSGEIHEKWVGWDWVCPGRVVVNGAGRLVRVRCGRVCKKLWLALPVWDLGKALADRGGPGVAVYERMRGVGGAGDGGGDGVREVGGQTRGKFRGRGLGVGRGLKPPPPGVACARCLGLRHDAVSSSSSKKEMDAAWNRFVTVISGGLLYGREVERPGMG